MYKKLTKKGAAKKFKLIEKDNKTVKNDDKVVDEDAEGEAKPQHESSQIRGTDGGGEKCRVTFQARQGVSGYFNDGPDANVQGHSTRARRPPTRLHHQRSILPKFTVLV